MYVICGLLAFSLGIMLSIQSGINAFLREMTSNPIFAVTINFSVGMLMILLATMIRYRRHTCKLTAFLELRKTKWWMWMGGPLGIIFVMAGALIPAYIGYGAFFSMIVTGELIFSAAVDHKGWLNNDIHPIDFRRAGGIMLLLVGAIFVQNA